MKISYLATLIIALAFCCSNATAQDKIHLRDGTTLKVKVKEVGKKNIIYRRWDNQEGADYVVTRREVDHITFENGTEDFLDSGIERRSADDEDDDQRADNRRSNEDDDRMIRPRHRIGDRSDRDREPVVTPGYGNNILSFAPIQMTNESVAGIGVQYERFLDKRGIFSINLPVAISFFRDNGFTNSSGTFPDKNRTFTYLYPGLKIYPGGSQHRISYSLGPSFGFGFGTKYSNETFFDPGTQSYYSKTSEKSIFKSGFLINNGLNLQPTKHLYIGLEFGIGFLYSNNEDTDFTVGNDPLVQFNFKLGYRF